MNYKEFEQQSSSIKSGLNGIMNELRERQKDWNLAEIPPEFQNAQEGLNRQDYNIVVCGEVKKGKSTLINAILGQDVLPTGVSETTSQVFFISQAETESYALVFEDGYREPITKDKLFRYGTQTAANQEGDPIFSGRLLKWIEVNVPASFLPPGIHLIDTPGLGATYAAHAEITLRHISEADAAVYVLDSKTPVVTQDIETLKRILDVTDRILFVQSKIDMVGSEECKIMQENHKSNLKKSLGDRLDGAIEVYPISSKLLKEAAADTDNQERFLRVSQFNKFRDALKMMIYRLSQFKYSIAAHDTCDKYNKSAMGWLVEQKNALGTLSREEKQNMQKEKTELGNQFTADWGPMGGKRRELMGDLQESLTSFRNSVSSLFHPGGEITPRFLQELQNCDTIEKVKAFNDNLPTALYNAVRSGWEQATNNLVARISHIVDSDSSLVPSTEIDMNCATGNNPLTIQGVSWTRPVQGGMLGMAIGTALAPVTGGLSLIVTGTLALMGGLEFARQEGENQRRQAQGAVERNINSIMSALNNDLLVAPHGDNGLSRFDSISKQCKDQFDASLTRQFEISKSRLEEEVLILQQQFDLSEQDRQNRLESIQTQQQTCLATSKSLDEELKALKQLRDMMVESVR